jgi:hypothetical protein
MHRRIESPTNDRGFPRGMPRRLSGGADHEIDREPNGWVRVTVRPARVSRLSWTPFVSLALGTGLGAGAGMLALGAGVGAVIAVGAALLRLARIERTLRHVAPAGTVWACAHGVKLSTGAFVARHTLTYVVYRNLVDESVASALRGGCTALRAARWLRRRHPARRVAFQIELHATGRVYPLVGRMTADTAGCAYDILSRLLGCRGPTLDVEKS